MIKAIIIDDEKGSIDSLLWELENFQETIKVVGISQSPSEGIQLIEKQQPDLLFLDINMPEMDGFQLIKKLNSTNFKIIFTTAYDQYAIKAFKVNAIDYLLKPINEEDLKKALDKILLPQTEKQFKKKLELLFENIDNKEKNQQQIVLPTYEGLEFVEVENIIRCESESNYSYIHLINEKPILVSKTLKDLEELLPEKYFYRVHHSHLINLKYIRKYANANQGTIILKDTTEIPISRRRKKDFLDGLQSSF